jgi:hypothetical protein
MEACKPLQLIQSVDLLPDDLSMVAYRASVRRLNVVQVELMLKARSLWKKSTGPCRQYVRKPLAGLYGADLPQRVEGLYDQ